MKCRFKRPDKKALFILSGSLLSIPMLAFFLWVFGINFTYTGSIPIGFYRIVPKDHIKQGDYVSFCLPEKIVKMGIERGYIKAGFCANGSEELIKKVIAIPGDKVKVTDDEIQVNSDSYYFAPTRIVDKVKLPVHRFINNGIYVAKGYWVYGNESPQYSWDSRYYGEISKVSIKHRLVPLLIF